MAQPTVLIAGAGPSGLVLAIVLIKNGVSVRLIDKVPNHRNGSRGTGVQPRTIELYDIIGCLPPLQEASGFHPTIAHYKPGEKEPFNLSNMVDWIEPSPNVPHPNHFSLPQEVHEEILRDYLAGMDCTVELGSELKSFEQFADHVVAHISVTREDGQSKEETATFKWLVGVDGAHSSVRKHLGVDFPGHVLTEHWIAIGDILVEEGLKHGVWHMWNANKNFLYLRSSGEKHKTFMFACGRPDNLSDTLITREEFMDQFYNATNRRDIKFGEMTWASNYRPSGRMADSMRVGRVFLAGDAAHIHSPTGGQGLNSSVQDAINLGWKLALVEFGVSPDSLLDSYSTERRRVIAQMLNLTSGILRKTMEQINSNDESKLNNQAWKRGGDTSMLGINYAGSEIILEGEVKDVEPTDSPYSWKQGGCIRAGTRAPDASELLLDKSRTRLFTLFDIHKHTLLLFGSVDAPSILAIVGRIPVKLVNVILLLPQGNCHRSDVELDGILVLHDSGGHAYIGYGLAPGDSTVVVVRPDAMVGAVVPDAAGVEQYLEKVFS
ncbi:FAD-binding-3 domain-containing protein [Mycena indigotica]|uniref:FAD-binding-3 domain-containing protein n=1 Tax=Mycena indigotica TaxID=2126181 RepID=A0A8H6S5F8_9AGAR|nr:FAD-binding-3 domain-containing protein [Mycena indigotica]KAF7292762.1 FAD-binding-3 domain-containing protein [Mycena indigotica]